MRRISGLYAVTPDEPDTAALAALVDRALRGGASVVQYRNKVATPALRVEQARVLARLCRDHDTCFIVNDHVELASEVGADGVHVGRDDDAVARARSLLGKHALIGVSCYDEIERAIRACDAGADYVAFGSFFASATKPGAVRARPELIHRSHAAVPLPVVAIGGITLANAPSLIKAGADALAVVSALFGAADVSAAASAFAALFPVRHS
ncbi:MAG: thiamine phosphate synthase [Vicinamibacterales bacterium]